jgi:gluconokinase
MILLVMGVTGSGKSTVALLLAKRLSWVFQEADDYHSAENKQKMHQGSPLTDADRFPWLAAIHTELVRLNRAGKNVVLACSALKEEYRYRLLSDLPSKVVYLRGTPELMRLRLSGRTKHFAGESILADQFAVLEEPQDALVVDVSASLDEIVLEILKKTKESSG